MKHVLIIVLALGFIGCNPSQESETAETNNQRDMETINQKAEQNKQNVRQFFEHLEAEDIQAFVNMFAEDGEQINPYSSGLFPTGAKGHEELTKYWEPVPQNFDGMEFIIEELLGTEHPNTVFVKYTGRIKLKNDAGYYENQYYSTFKFNESGKITEYVEIFNPIVAAQAFGLTENIK